MKTLRQTEIDRLAAVEIRVLICKHGERNLDRLTLAIRRQARELGAKKPGAVARETETAPVVT